MKVTRRSVLVLGGGITVWITLCWWICFRVYPCDQAHSDALDIMSMFGYLVGTALAIGAISWEERK